MNKIISKVKELLPLIMLIFALVFDFCTASDHADSGAACSGYCFFFMPVLV